MVNLCHLILRSKWLILPPSVAERLRAKRTPRHLFVIRHFATSNSGTMLNRSISAQSGKSSPLPTSMQFRPPSVSRSSISQLLAQFTIRRLCFRLSNYSIPPPRMRPHRLIGIRPSPASRKAGSQSRPPPEYPRASPAHPCRRTKCHARLIFDRLHNRRQVHHTTPTITRCANLAW